MNIKVVDTNSESSRIINSILNNNEFESLPEVSKIAVSKKKKNKSKKRIKKTKKKK